MNNLIKAINDLCEASYESTGTVYKSDVIDLIEEAMNKPLDERMKDAGMLSIDEMVNGRTHRLMLNAGVTDFDTFLFWLEMKRREASTLFARIELKENSDDDEMYEWALAHHAIYGEIHGQFKAILEKAK